jgi:hypothetical protein
MSIKIKPTLWNQELLIETDNGKAKIYLSGNEIKIDNDQVLKDIGLTVGDALAIFFDQAANPQTKARFQTYLNRKSG